MRGYSLSLVVSLMVVLGACGGDDGEPGVIADAAVDAPAADGGSEDAAAGAGGSGEEDGGVDGALPSESRCGDGNLDEGEACDDGNDRNGDGCSKTCMVEEGFNCPVVGAACEQCGNGVVESSEQCDDGNRDADDGCDDSCAVEDGWVCPVAGQPCELCGNGVVEANERCDDGNDQDGDGCSADCRGIEPNFSCPVAGQPCVECGDGSVGGEELCDDGNTESGDGCVFNCRAVEPGWKCPAGGGACSLCGDGTLQEATEQCDDGNFQSGDGCSSDCQIEPGAICLVSGVLCSVCGNGFIEYTTYLGDNGTPGDPSDDFADPEQCDDGNLLDGDGCSSDCVTEDGGDLPWICPVPGMGCGRCGDGVVQEIEACDDGRSCDGGSDGGSDCTSDSSTCMAGGGACDPAAGDGCSADCTAIEPGYLCPAGGGACVLCGDGQLDASLEECDDGNVLSGDGCNRLCLLEANLPWVCPEPGQPCELCGNGVVEAQESCDDGNTDSGDGCAGDCQSVEPNYNCFFPGFACFLCGDGVIEVGEECDEGQIATPANATGGCNELCRIVDPWVCPLANAPCELCGDGVVDPFESCDDGNAANGDGCDSTCQIEPGYDCSGPACVAAACGDGFVAGDEECDDGNLLSGDGCSYICRVEAGFSCAGSIGCHRTACGDGIVEGAEQCDDGSVCTGTSSGTLDDTDCTTDATACLADNGACGPLAGDGCDAQCWYEVGYMCPVPGQPCVPAVCGNGVVEGGEQCDDGSVCTGTSSGALDNADCTADATACLADSGTCGPVAGDGCGGQCQLEPGYYCPDPGLSCLPTVCGDGLVQGLEQCDDGSVCAGGTEDGKDCTSDFAACEAGGGSCLLVGGDGCALDCTVETFYRCSGEPSVCRPITEFVVLRRFNVANVSPDALNYNPDRRSFAGHKSSASLPSIELCLDGTIINRGDTTAGPNGTVYLPGGGTQELPATCTGATTDPDDCYVVPLRPEPLASSQLGSITGSAFDPVTGHYLFLDMNGQTVILTELPRDILPYALPAGFDLTDYQVTLTGLTKPGELTVGEDGDLYVVDDATDQVLVYPRRRDENLDPVWPDCPANGADPGGNCTSFEASPDAARGWSAPSGDPLVGIFTVPGEDMVGIFNRYVGAPPYDGSDALDPGAVITNSEYFTFYDIYSAADPPLYGRSGLPGLLFDLGNTGRSYTKEAMSAETAPDGGSFIICPRNPSESCQLFAHACESDADCPPGTVCNLDGVNTVGAAYCHAPGDARDDRYRVDRDVVGETNPVALNVLLNDSLSESACVDPRLRIVSACGDGVQQQYEIDHPDSCTDEPVPRGTVTWIEGDETIGYDAPDDKSCGFIDTFTYTADLGGGVYDTASVRVLVACVCGDGVVDPNEQCDDGAYNGAPGQLVDVAGTPGDTSDDVYAHCSTSCYWNVYCGDSFIVAPEQCDDGNAVSGDGCSAICTLESVCGNDVVEGVEVCDDGRQCTDWQDCTADASLCAGIGDDSCETRGGDGCNANCTVPVCGDGRLDLDNPVLAEQCDDGNLRAGDGCSSTCQVEARCGNGIIEPPEQCDDGNAVSGDGCSAICTVEGICGNDIREGAEVCDGADHGDCPVIDSAQIMCINEPRGAPNICLCQNFCGDGAIGGLEECDDGMAGSATCRGAQPAQGSPCTLIRCGDGIVDTAAGEECDDGNANPADTCTNNCKLVTVCGDGVKEGAEECDDGNNISGDGCSSTCKLEVTVCGNGVLEYNEQCDDGNTIPGDGCNQFCRIEAGACGNGKLDPGEQCDDGNTVSGDGCDRYCQSELCGNGVIDFAEQCDDGNRISGDGCSATCYVEIG